jgi:hypothetical protein
MFAEDVDPGRGAHSLRFAIAIKLFEASQRRGQPGRFHHLS